MSEQRRFAFDAGDAIEATGRDPLLERDRAARLMATDPGRSVALEASAGTGKTRVLVDRYVRLVGDAGVSPRNILAMTFTRKAAAEMRQRVLDTLRARHAEGSIDAARWREIRDAFPDITISTIDAFCLALLREFPLEAGVDPGFDLADETETPRLVALSLDRAIRVARSLARTDPAVALLLADLGEARLRHGLAVLLDRRLIAWEALNRFLHGRTLGVEDACERLHGALRAALSSLPGGARAFVRRGPRTPDVALLAADVALLDSGGSIAPERLRASLDRLSRHVLTATGEARQRLAHKKSDFASAADYDVHRAHVLALGPRVAEAAAAYRRDLNVVLARGVRQVFALARDEYRRTLAKHGVLDFSDVLEHTLALLERRDEFSRSRYKLEARYRHVLVDEFQDTSRAQWRLVRELMSAWAEGAGAGDAPIPPSIFIVGDRKQSIYGFRDAEVALLDEAGRYIEALRPETPARAAITRSHRAVLPLLQFVNDVCDAIEKQPGRADAFRYSDDDRFPLGDRGLSPSPIVTGTVPVIGIAAGATDAEQAEMVAGQIARLLVEGVTVRDRLSGLPRPVSPGDIAVLFRTREGHRLFEQALARRRVPYYVYKGLGFFDADEIRDVLALVAWLADPSSNLRAAAFLRSGFVRLSDEALKWLAPDLAAALAAGADDPVPEELAADDRARLRLARASAAAWLPLVDTLPPAELLDLVLAESAYASELAGPGYRQARENLKKIRAFIRRQQNRGYATLERLVEHFSQLVAGGDESNAIIDAVDAVNLMTVHAVKGLEFPVVFVVNLTRGSGGGRDPIRVAPAPIDAEGGEPSVGIGDHRTEADADAEARDLEETKRLLYVAITRARDRVYLCATRSSDGRFWPYKGSLGRVLPESLHAVFEAEAGAAGEATLRWTGPSATHELERIRIPGPEPLIWGVEPSGSSGAADLDPLQPDGRLRLPVTGAEPDAGGSTLLAGDGSSAALGRLVHRLLAGTRSRQPITREEITDMARRSLEAQLDPEDTADLAGRAVEVALAIAGRPSVQAVLAQGRAVFEAPYSALASDGSVERGVIDCLVVGAEHAWVIEFKTGAPQEAHERQLAAYVRAAQAFYPGRTVEGRLVYAGAE